MFVRVKGRDERFVSDIECSRVVEERRCRLAFDGGPKFVLAPKAKAFEVSLPACELVPDDLSMDLELREKKAVHLKADAYRVERRSCATSAMSPKSKS